VGLGVPVSVDTYKPEVMQAVLDLGADIINDVWALRWRDPVQTLSAADVVASARVRRVPDAACTVSRSTMQASPMEGDATAQVRAFLDTAAMALRQRGVQASRICIDPGIGFWQNGGAELFAAGPPGTELLTLGYPVLAGWSRASHRCGAAKRLAVCLRHSEPAQRMVPASGGLRLQRNARARAAGA